MVDVRVIGVARATAKCCGSLSRGQWCRSRSLIRACGGTATRLFALPCSNDVLPRGHWPGREGTATSAVAVKPLTDPEQFLDRLLVFREPGAGEIVVPRALDLHEPLRPVDRVVEALAHVERN